MELLLVAEGEQPVHERDLGSIPVATAPGKHKETARLI